MNSFYFVHRNIGLDPDTNKYYFTSVDDLINKVSVLKSTHNRDGHIRWSVSKSKYLDDHYALMHEFWSTERRGTDDPVPCKGWFVCGYIHTDETTRNIYDILPKWEADYTNHFIERRYMAPADYNGLSDVDKEKCIKDGGIILNKQKNIT